MIRTDDLLAHKKISLARKSVDRITNAFTLIFRFILNALLSTHGNYLSLLS